MTDWPIHAYSIMHRGLFTGCGVWMSELIGPEGNGPLMTDNDADVTCPECREMITDFEIRTGRRVLK